MQFIEASHMFFAARLDSDVSCCSLQPVGSHLSHNNAFKPPQTTLVVISNCSNNIKLNNPVPQSIGHLTLRPFGKIIPGISG
jgi:hypothetical protein